MAAISATGIFFLARPCLGLSVTWCLLLAGFALVLGSVSGLGRVREGYIGELRRGACICGLSAAIVAVWLRNGRKERLCSCLKLLAFFGPGVQFADL